MRINEQRDLFRSLVRQVSLDLAQFSQDLQCSTKYNWPQDWIRTGEVVARLRGTLDMVDQTLADNNLMEGNGECKR